MISVGLIVKLQHYASLSTTWVIMSLITGIFIVVYGQYCIRLNWSKYSIWVIPTVFLILLNLSISTSYISLNLQAILFAILGLNLSYRFLPQIKANRE